MSTLLPGRRLFERIPDTLFRPLSSENRHQYWEIICVLYDQRFGPDAPLPPLYGYPLKMVQGDIELLLINNDAWMLDGETGGAEISIHQRALHILRYLIQNGWFYCERYGLVETVAMGPAVRQVIDSLIQFADAGPLFLSGKIQSIHLNLRQVLGGTGFEDQLPEAANQSLGLLEHVRNTGTNVRDFMATLSAETHVANYARRFFQDYVTQIYIGDYRDLRTKDHPYAKLPDILAAIEELDHIEANRTRLIDWYTGKRARGDRALGQSMFERDLNRIRKLGRVHEYLLRLDDEIRSANLRASATFEYHLKSSKPVDKLVKRAITAIQNGSPAESAQFPSGFLMAPQLLALPRTRRERRPPSPLRNVIVSDEVRAANLVRRRAEDRRTVTVRHVLEFVAHEVMGSGIVDIQDIEIDSIEKLRLYQELSVVAQKDRAVTPSVRRSARNLAPGVHVSPNGRGPQEDALIQGGEFSMELRSAKAGRTKEGV